MTSPGDRVAEKVRVLLELDRNGDAGRAAMDGLQSEPDNAVLIGLLAYALEADGYSRDARMWAERSLSLDPQQAWVHSVRARAILNGAGTPQEAAQSAYAAVQLDHANPAYRYTLTRAYLESKQPDHARATAESIRAVAPASALGPLAQALVEIDKARFFHVHPVWAVLMVLITRGLALLVYAIAWLFFYLRRRGPLRRADAHLLEALRLDPGNANTHAIAAAVARYRFRYVQAVDSALASAAIDTGMIDADELARGIARRTSLITLAAFAFWAVWLPVLQAAGHVVAPVVATLLAIVAAAGVGWLYREQTRRLPPGVLRMVRRRWELPVTVIVIAVLAITAITALAL